MLQWLSTLVAALRADHVGWRFDQSAAAFASIQGAFDLVDGDLPRQGPGILWPIVLSPFASVADAIDGVLAGAVLLNVLVLAPLALVAAYRIAARSVGAARRRDRRALDRGAMAPARAYAREVRPVVRDRVLPLLLGLTADPAFPAAVALVCSAALIASSLDRRSLAGAALAGLVAGAGVAIEPHSLLFLGGAAGAYIAARRVPEAGLFALALAPAVLAVALWQARAVDGPDPLAFGPVDWGQFTTNMAGLREFFWSQRLLQWLPLAGTIAVARRSIPLALLLGGWMISFGVVLGSQAEAGLAGGASSGSCYPLCRRTWCSWRRFRCSSRHSPSRLGAAGARVRTSSRLARSRRYAAPRAARAAERGSRSGRPAWRSRSSSAAARRG